jgi:hypothetical protein
LYFESGPHDPSPGVAASERQSRGGVSSEANNHTVNFLAAAIAASNPRFSFTA